jgi:hypothetical protein
VSAPRCPGRIDVSAGRRQPAPALRRALLAPVAFIPFVALMPLASPGCGVAPQALTPAHAATVRAEALAYVASLPDDLARDGPAGWLPHFAADGSFSMASDGALTFPSLEAARAEIGRFAPTIARMELRWIDPRVDVLTHDLAAFAAGYDEVLTDIDGRDATYAGYVTGLLARTRAGWRIRRLHWSAPVPAKAP